MKTSRGGVFVAKKSAKGAVPPPDSVENKVTCYLCPGVTFSSTEVLRIHCFEEHQIVDYILKDLACRPLTRLNKCDFCIYRSPLFSKLTDHLTEFHTAEDIYFKCLSTWTAKEENKTDRKIISRKRKSRNEREPIEHGKSLIYCPVCSVTKNCKEELTIHLETDHNIHRNVDLLLSYSFKTFQP